MTNFQTQLNKFTTENNKKQIDKERIALQNPSKTLKHRENIYKKCQSLEKNNSLNFDEKYRVIKFVKNEFILANKNLNFNSETFKFDFPVQNFYASENLIVVLTDGTIQSYENTCLKNPQILKTDQIITNSDFHSQLNFILLSSPTHFSLFDLNVSKKIFSVPFETNYLKIHNDGNLLLTGQKNCNLTDIRSLKTLFTFGESVDGANFINSHFVCFYTKNVLKCVDIRNFESVGIVLGNKSKILNLKIVENETNSVLKSDIAISVSESNTCVSMPYLSLILKNEFVGGIDADFNGDKLLILDGKSVHTYY